MSIQPRDLETLRIEASLKFLPAPWKDLRVSKSDFGIDAVKPESIEPNTNPLALLFGGDWHVDPAETVLAWIQPVHRVRKHG
jgi:hypothetical protein